MWSNPTNGKVRLQDGYGAGDYNAPRDNGKRKHKGVDLCGVNLQDVLAPTDGKVERFGYCYKDDLTYRYVAIRAPGDHVRRGLLRKFERTYTPQGLEAVP